MMIRIVRGFQPLNVKMQEGAEKQKSGVGSQELAFTLHIGVCSTINWRFRSKPTLIVIPSESRESGRAEESDEGHISYQVKHVCHVVVSLFSI